MEEIRIYRVEDIPSIQWPHTPDGQYAKNYLQSFMEKGSNYYIHNVKTQMMVLQIADLLLPMTINEEEYENSYVCSPYGHYITYAQEELPLVGGLAVQIPLRWFLKGLGWVLKDSQINRVVIVNNWLLSTNLYPSITTAQLHTITQKLVSSFPNHAILFRSVTDHRPYGLKSSFDELDYHVLVSRQVYFFDPFTKDALRNQDLKRDIRLLDASGYEVIDRFSSEDIPRLVELYNMLYLDKYSMNNPQFNDQFVHLALQKKTLTIKGLKKGNCIDGVIGFFIRNGVMTTPFFGYDTTLPQETGLYRMLSAQLVREAQERKLLLHQSSGAASFKRTRKAYPIMEYTMAYTKHLPPKRQKVWSHLSWMMGRVAKPLLEKYQL
jgi:hypothetical protein